MLDAQRTARSGADGARARGPALSYVAGVVTVTGLAATFLNALSATLAELENTKCPQLQENMAPFDCPSLRAKRRALFCREGEEGAEGWPRDPKRARAGAAAVAWPCHAGRQAHSMRPGGLGQARRRAGSAFYDIAGQLTSDSGLLTVSERSGRGLSCAVCVQLSTGADFCEHADCAAPRVASLTVGSGRRRRLPCAECMGARTARRISWAARWGHAAQAPSAPARAACWGSRTPSPRRARCMQAVETPLARGRASR